MEKAVAVTDRYATPACLLRSYQEEEAVNEMLLSNITFGTHGKRKIGDALSKQIHIMFSKCSVTNI